MYYKFQTISDYKPLQRETSTLARSHFSVTEQLVTTELHGTNTYLPCSTTVSHKDGNKIKSLITPFSFTTQQVS